MAARESPEGQIKHMVDEVARLKAKLADAEYRATNAAKGRDEAIINGKADLAYATAREATARAEEREHLAKWHDAQAGIAEKNMNTSALSDETEGWRRAMWAHRQSATAIRARSARLRARRVRALLAAEQAKAPPDWNKTQRPDGTWAADDKAPFDIVAHLTRQMAWSEKTFGPGRRTKGVIDHIRKELTEIEADPTDLSEWIDVVILAFDGAWRAGWEPEKIVEAIAAKQAKNEIRNWPDWRTVSQDHAIEHDRSAEQAKAPPERAYVSNNPRTDKWGRPLLTIKESRHANRYPPNRELLAQRLDQFANSPLVTKSDSLMFADAAAAIRLPPPTAEEWQAERDRLVTEIAAGEGGGEEEGKPRTELSSP